MSAIVCGKRSFFDDIPSSPTSASPPISKKIRRASSTSPVRFSVAPSPTSLFHQLRAQFPDMDSQLIEKALEECGYNLDAAIKSLNEMQLGRAQGKSSADVETNTNMQNVPSEDPTLQCNLPVDGSGWVELLLKEMMGAASIDDARARASRVLESLEKSISLRAGAESTQNIQKENMMLKEQVEALIRDNTLLKRAVAIQHERQKEHDDKSQEVQHLKQLVSQYQQQLSSLEVSNYALKMHLLQAQQGNNIPGRFHPDVF
nr:Biogenesis of lysosome-related organelles complex 1 subunit 6 like [Ipomoea batatas]